MNAIALLVSLSLSGQMWGDFPDPALPVPVVEQEIECVSVAHLPDGGELLFFFDFVQGEWALLDHRWSADGMSLAFQDGVWLLSWHDHNDGCYRIMRAKHWQETWERESPLADEQNRPWFRRLCAPGLKKP